MESDTELVLGLAREDVPGGLGWRGVRGVSLEPYLEAVKRSGSYRPRTEAETDPSWKQVIPYLLLRDGERLFLMRRTRAGGDPRLHRLYTIGVGGHVNPGDNGVIGGLLREWLEELEADFVPDFEPVGLLNDDSNPVGAVHLGLVFAADARGRTVKIREADKLSGSFVAFDAAAKVAYLMETWSALLFDFLTTSVSSPTAAR